MKNSSKNKGKAILYSPYLDVLGGGERHILSIMDIIRQSGYAVDLAWNDATIAAGIRDKLRIDPSGFTIVPNFFSSVSRKEKQNKTSEYDILIYVTDGSYFFSSADRNYIFCMYPDRKLYALLPTNWMKLRNFDVIANSAFTAERISGWLKKEAAVLHPFVDEAFFVKGRQKKPVIISVGRFFGHLHSKRQDVLIEAFIKLKNDYKQFADFSLQLVGGLKKEDEEYYRKLEKMSSGRNDIVLKTNISFNELTELYASSAIYWHAAGFGINENEHPERVEHLGITPLEAMASGCLTFCHDSGGPKRYIQQSKTGYLYTSVDDLVHKTAVGYAELQKNDSITEAARHFVSAEFSYPVFKNKVEQYFKL